MRSAECGIKNSNPMNELNVKFARAVGWRECPDEPGYWINPLGGKVPAQAMPAWDGDLTEVQYEVRKQDRDFKQAFEIAQALICYESKRMLCELTAVDWMEAFVRAKAGL